MPNTASPAARRQGVTGVHSVLGFAMSVPSLDDAEAFYSAFGLDVRRDGDRLALHTFGNPHRWGSIAADGGPKRLEYLTLGMFPEDQAALRDRIATARVACEPHPGSD